MIKAKMNKGEFELNVIADKIEFYSETVMIIWQLTEAYAGQRALSFDAAFDEIREKVEMAKELEKKK